MIEVIVQAMTDAQKKMVVDAKDKDVVCVTQKVGKKYSGLVQVYRAPGIAGIVARTGNVFDDDAEAMDVAEGVVDAIRDASPEVEVVEDEATDAELEAEIDGMLKDAIEENEAEE